MGPLPDETESSQENQSCSAPTTESVVRQSGNNVIVNLASVDNDDDQGDDIPDELPLDRNNYGITGSSREDVQQSWQCTQPSGQVSTTTGSIPTPQQTNSTQATGADTGIAGPVQDSSISAPALLQEARSESLNPTPNQHDCTSSTASTPVTCGAQPPTRLDSTESTDSKTSQNSEGRVPSSYGPSEMPAAPFFSNDHTTNTFPLSSIPLPATQLPNNQRDALEIGLFDNHGVVGSSRKDVTVQRPWQCTELPAGQVSSTTSTSWQPGNTQTPPGPLPSATNNNVPLYSQHSDDSGTNCLPDNSISTPQPDWPGSLNLTPIQAQSTAPTPDNRNTYYGTQCPSRLNSEESTNSDI